MSAQPTRLSDVVQINPRLPASLRDRPPSLVTFLKMAYVSEEGFISDFEVRSFDEVKKGFTYFEEGDVLLAKITPCFENGKAALAENLPHRIGFGSTEFHVLRAGPKVFPRYLFYLIWSESFRKTGQPLMAGAAGQKRLPADFLENLKIELPSLDDQKLISTVLDKADALRRQRRESLQLTEKLLQSVFIDMFGDPEKNPLGFPKCSIGDLLVSASYGTSAKANSEGTWPILRMGNITYAGGWDFSSLKYIELDSKEEQKYLVRPGEILFNRTNSKELVGKTAVYREERPMAFAGYLIRCRVNEQADPEYISAFLNSLHGKKVLQSMCKSIVGMANINAKELQAITILKPPVALQKKFGETVRSILRLRESVIEAATSDGLLFGAVQQRAFRGDLKLSSLTVEKEIEPNEQAAAELRQPVSVGLSRSPETRRVRLSFVAPPEIEEKLNEDDLRIKNGGLIPWSENYFQYRILGRVLEAPYCFTRIWEAVTQRIMDADYDVVKEKVLGYLADGTLRQRFDKKAKSVGFLPLPHMKLLRLKLGVDFRSLAAGFEVHFLRELNRDYFNEFHPYCLVGRNGSGKSNVLEALAAIFYHIECIYLTYRPERFEEEEYELQTRDSASTEHLPSEAHSLVIIEKVESRLRIRVFDADGTLVSDKSEPDLVKKGLDSLKEELGLDGLPDVKKLNRREQKRIVRMALSCSGLAVPSGFSPDEGTPDAYELEYLIPDNAARRGQVLATYKGHLIAHIRISKEVGQRPVIRYNAGFPDSDQAGEELSRQEAKLYLPKYIIGYSSGQNEILSLPFFKMRFIHFDEYRDKLAKGDFYGKPEGRMIYVDDQFSQAILICLFLFPSKVVNKVFEEKVGLTGIRRFRIIIRRHHRIPVAAERLQSMSTEEQKDETENTVELTSKLAGHVDEQNRLQPGLIDKLTKCSTTHYKDFSRYTDGEGFDLYLDYWINEATRRAFQVHFGEASGESQEINMAKSALNLFQSFQTLLTLNHYNVDEETKFELYKSDSLYVNETIPIPASHERITRFKEGELMKNGVTEKLYVKSLSDGEHQLLHTIGLCLLYRHESALFLLDEPETHLNPDWRASYISTLRAALETDESTSKVMREVLLTSHSPFIVSDCRPENVLVFQKNANGEVKWHNPDFNTFGASANAITIKVFGQKESIGDYAALKLTELRDRLTLDGNPDDLIEKANNLFGDSVEKILFINQALSRKEGK